MQLAAAAVASPNALQKRPRLQPSGISFPQRIDFRTFPRLSERYCRIRQSHLHVPTADTSESFRRKGSAVEGLHQNNGFSGCHCRLSAGKSPAPEIVRAVLCEPVSDLPDVGTPANKYEPTLSGIWFLLTIADRKNQRPDAELRRYAGRIPPYRPGPSFQEAICDFGNTGSHHAN